MVDAITAQVVVFLLADIFKIPRNLLHELLELDFTQSTDMELVRLMDLFSCNSWQVLVSP